MSVTTTTSSILLGTLDRVASAIDAADAAGDILAATYAAEVMSALDTGDADVILTTANRVLRLIDGVSFPGSTAADVRPSIRPTRSFVR
jgi:hypothetical protein